MQLTGCTILVTGGASGLGAAVAEMTVAAGGRVVILDIDGAAADAQAGRHGDAAVAVAGSISDERDVQTAVDTAVARFGRLDGLVNAAGIAPADRVLGRDGTIPLARFTRAVEVNLIGTFNAVRLAVAAMARNVPDDGGARGVVVNTASIAAFDGQVGQAAYAASKGGVVALTLPLARELARVGIRVVTIAPGAFDTPLLSSLPGAVRESLAAQAPFPPRLGRPEEYASLVREIFENEMLNGEVIRLDGALRMSAR